MFLLEIYGVKSHNELGDISNPSSGNSSYFSLSRAIERSSFTSVTSCFMLLYWIYRFLSFDRGPDVDLCKLSQVYELELAFLNRIPT